MLLAIANIAGPLLRRKVVMPLKIAGIYFMKIIPNSWLPSIPEFILTFASNRHSPSITGVIGTPSSALLQISKPRAAPYAPMFCIKVQPVKISWFVWCLWLYSRPENTDTPPPQWAELFWKVQLRILMILLLTVFLNNVYLWSIPPPPSVAKLSTITNSFTVTLLLFDSSWQSIYMHAPRSALFLKHRFLCTTI